MMRSIVSLIAIIVTEGFGAPKRSGGVYGFQSFVPRRAMAQVQNQQRHQSTPNNPSTLLFNRRVQYFNTDDLRVPDSPNILYGSRNNNDGNTSEGQKNPQAPSWLDPVLSDPKRTLLFSLLMSLCGASLGPFLDSYHSAFGVLQYDDPITAILWGTASQPALTTTWWVPALFGLAGFIIGWLYILLDSLLLEKEGDQRISPTPPLILVSISMFTLQYWLSGILYASIVDRTTILNVMSVIAAVGFLSLDGTLSGVITSTATAICGPLIEAGLLTASLAGYLPSGYHYTDLGETGYFPLWILPVYFLGGPAVGNLARGFWNGLSKSADVEDEKGERRPCFVCNDTRRDICPNCDGIGEYAAMGGQSVTCTSCKGRGYVICRACFDRYDEDPNDIEGIRDLISRMPD